MEQKDYQNLFYLSSFITFVGFLVVVVSFWSSELYFWNYSPFKIGGFTNTVPEYATYDINILATELQKLLSAIELGALLFTIGFVLILFSNFKLKSMNSKLLAALAFGTSLLAGIGFWTFTSLNLGITSGDYQINNNNLSLITPTTWVQKLIPSVATSYAFQCV